MQNELKPCPFCGGENVEVFHPKYNPFIGLYQVQCYDCHFGYKQCHTEKEAVAAWNRRANDGT